MPELAALLPTSPAPAASAPPSPRPIAAAPAAVPVPPRWVVLARLAPLLAIAVAVILAYQWHDGFRGELGRATSVLASGDGVAIGDYLLSFGVWAPAVSLLLMILQAISAPVPAVLIAFANGLAFGVFWGGLLTLAGQTLAAACCFGIARALGRAPVEALTGKLGLEQADRWFARWGARSIFLTRLVPGISFDLVSYAAGLTAIRFAPFIAATALGTAPQAFLYAYLIREAPRYAWALVAVSWLIVLALGAAAFVRGRRRGTPLAGDLPRGVTWRRAAADDRHGSTVATPTCPAR